MKLRNLFYLLLTLPLFVVGCNNDPDVQRVELVSTMESDILEFDIDGGTGIITYSLLNAPKDAVVEATCEADWIANLTVGTNVMFKVLPNDDAARSAEIVVSYKDQSFTVIVDQSAQTYVHDVSFTSAYRISLVGSYPDNYIYIAMINEEANAQFTVLLLVDENENILTAGVYDDNSSNIIASVSALSINGSEISFESCINSIVVEGDITNYSIVAKFTDAQNQKYRIRFNGVIDEMGENINHYPETDVTMVANEIYGMYYEQMFSNTYNYSLYLSDLGFTDDIQFIGNGQYFSVDLYGIEPVIDEEGYLFIPAGTYTANQNFEEEDWSICANYSQYFIVNENVTGYYTYCRFDSATVVVTENSISLVATSGDITFTATYNGEPKYFVGIPEKIEGRDFVGEKLDVMYYGTMYSDTYNYYVIISDKGLQPGTASVLPSATYYCLDLYGVEPVVGADGSLTIPYGTYTFDKKNTCAEWTVGNRYSEYFMVNADCSDYEVSAQFDDITVVVSESGISATGVIQGGTHTIVYNGAPTFFAEETRAAQREKGINF